MKHILLINDVVGYGNVGMVAMMPILTYMGHSTYNLPTSLVSNTLDYGRFNIMETTDYIRGTMSVWEQLNFHFDAVCTGLMFSEEQAKLVSSYCRSLREKSTMVIVDPIMGDAGRLYNGIDRHQVDLMREMVSIADLICPNFTEACYLTDTAYESNGFSWSEACTMLDSLAEIGARNVIVTSAKVDGHSCVVGRHSDVWQDDSFQGDCKDKYFKINYEEIPVLFHGTGDIFSAVLVGHIMNGQSLYRSTQTAMDVVSQLIDRNRNMNDKCLGIPIEKCLDLL